MSVCYHVSKMMMILPVIFLTARFPCTRPQLLHSSLRSVLSPLLILVLSTAAPFELTRCVTFADGDVLVFSSFCTAASAPLPSKTSSVLRCAPSANPTSAPPSAKNSMTRRCDGWVLSLFLSSSVFYVLTCIVWYPAHFVLCPGGGQTWITT